jgi:hypothetical protein
LSAADANLRAWAKVNANVTRLDRAALAAVLVSQHKVVSRRQAIGCGMIRDMLQRRSRPGGQWQRLLPGVYLAVTGTPTAGQRDMAALLYAGSGAMITASAALRRHGLLAPQTEFIDALSDPGEAEAAERRIRRGPSDHGAAHHGLRQR